MVELENIEVVCFERAQRGLQLFARLFGIALRGFAGYDEIVTPTLDRLADHFLVFTPLDSCGPYRYS